MTDWLVYATPGRGHIYPAVATLLELRERGHHIAIRCGSQEAGELAALGFDAEPVAAPVEAVDSDDFKARTPIGAQRLEVRAFARRAAAGVRLPAPKLRADRLRAAVRQAIAMRPGAQRIAESFAAAGGAAAAADALEQLAGAATPRATAPGRARSAR